MRIRIHRGAREIGGSCVELEQDGASLFLDAGLPLESDMGGRELLPVGLRAGGAHVVGLAISHGHPDHVGLVTTVDPGVPVFMGAATERILTEAAFFSRVPEPAQVAEHLMDRVPLQAGPFTVTPYLMDHSAFDAYALLVEAGGRRLLYSGDLRAHGRKAAFDQFLADPPGGIDVLLLEGTTLRRSRRGACATEREVEEQCVALFARTQGLVLAAYSPQNIDRLVSIFRAARRVGRVMVLDLYGASIARATGRASVPQGAWDSVRVYVPQAQRVRVKESGQFERVEELERSRIYVDEISARPAEFVLTFRGSMSHELDRAGCTAGAGAVWSLWPGYLERRGGVATTDWFAARDIPMDVVHASGHASASDLQRFAQVVGARVVVPIHTAYPRDYTALFDNVSIKEDGQWWEA